MNKIIAAIDGLKYAESTVQYAIMLAGKCNAHLVGVFLEDFTYQSYKITALVEGSENFRDNQQTLQLKDMETRQHAIDQFESACGNAGVNYSTHRDRNIAIHELLHESIFADLLIIDGGETLTHYDEPVPSKFIKELLAKVQCPVLVVPHQYKEPQKLIFLYNGDPSSVHAIRTFSHLFDSLRYLKAEVVSVNGPRQSFHLPDNRLMKEFMKRHYPGVEYVVLKGNAEMEILEHLASQRDSAVIILGAYGRNTLSRWMKVSMADSIMTKLSFPVFIAHN